MLGEDSRAPPLEILILSVWGEAQGFTSLTNSQTILADAGRDQTWNRGVRPHSEPSFPPQRGKDTGVSALGEDCVWVVNTAVLATKETA